ncbi:MAG: TPM domain-containing protein [Akkermansiaceae bacterium]
MGGHWEVSPLDARRKNHVTHQARLFSKKPLLSAAMQCPYCRAPLTETSKECPQCQISVKSAAALLGPMPRYSKGINDRQNTLANNEQKKIQTALADLTRRFPQIEMHILIQTFNNQYPLATHLFWVFNEGEFCSADRKGGKNHSILLGLDTKHGRIGLIPGYGLEPFLPTKALDHILEKVHPLLAEAEYGKAILAVIASLDELLSGICESIEENLGIQLATDSKTTEY